MSKSENHKEFKKPFKLEEFPRENMFKVPDGYFDELPRIIQERVTKKPATSNWREVFLTPANGWKAVLAVAVIAMVLVFSGVFNSNTYEGSVEDILAEVSLEDLIEYVEYSDISTEEILAELDLSGYEMNDFMGEDIQLLDEGEFEDLDMLDLYEVYGIEEELF